MLTKCKLGNKDPYLALLEIRNTPVDNYLSPNELSKGRLCRSTVPAKASKYNVRKTYNQKEFEQTRAKCKNLQRHYYHRSAKTLSDLEEGDTV